MRNYLITLRFDGAGYHGWQIQQNAVTVQQTLQQAMAELFGTRPDLKGCSRTDAGVHAKEFCVSFFADTSVPADKIPDALNVRLPRDLAVLSCREVPPDFHARYSCLGKRYVYRILNTPRRDPFWEGRALHFPAPIDEALLDRAAQGFIGTHDFSAFCAAGSSVEDPVRTIYSARVTREKELVSFSVAGNGFLYNMVRIMTGTLLAVAMGKLDAGEIPAILSSRDRFRAGATAPAQGLYLEQVFYDDAQVRGISGKKEENADASQE